MSGLVPNTKGGGQRGGPRRWTGGGPRPARHIPWPELFKHHESVLTGHLKMMDMVRKHCVEGTPNYETAHACVERTQEMLRVFKKAANNFVPPRDNIERVPLGASSASMYPGYSPADHIYGEAAAEHGRQVVEAKKKGIEIKPNLTDSEFEVGQSSGDGSKRPESTGKQKPAPASRKVGVESASESDAESSNDVSELFVIDSNPTPIDQLHGSSAPTKGKNKANDKAKRRVSFQEEAIQAEGLKIPSDSHKKKAKTAPTTKNTEEVKSTAAEDDFETAVEARHTEKEEKRKRKEDKKKRKRESSSSQIVETESSEAKPERDIAVDETIKEKPKKKKLKSDGESAGSGPPGEDKKGRKRERKEKRSNSGVEESNDVEDDGEGRKRKRKKEV